MFRVFIGISSVISRRENFQKVSILLREHLKTRLTVYPWSHPKASVLAHSGSLNRWYFLTGVSLLHTGGSDYVLTCQQDDSGQVAASGELSCQVCELVG